MGEDFTETNKDKNDMIEVNDRFVILIDKVNEHELRNKQLEGELKILTLKQNHSRKVETIVGQAKKDLEQQVETLRRDQEKLKIMLSRYNEEEFNIRHKEKEANKAELEQKILKITKDLEKQQVKKVGLMVEKRVLSKNLELLRAGFDEEIKELESQVQNEKKVISDPNKRSLDLEPIIKSVEMKYVEMASRAKEEAEQLNQKKMDALVQTAGQQKQEMLLIEKEITVLLKSINRLTTEKQTLQTEENILRNELEEEGEDDEESTLNGIIKLEEHLQKNRENLAEQVLRQQELLNIKLALDVEIATYGKLLENEEESIKNATDV